MTDAATAAAGQADAARLATIPLIVVGKDGLSGLIDRAPRQLDTLLCACEARYGRLTLAIGDAVSRRWLAGGDNPYRHEIFAIARRIGRPGPTMLNLSYEWSCTSSVGTDPEAGGNRLLRTLDWPTPALGRTVVVARQTGRAGEYFNVTWPGFVGVLTAMAPGRFSAAINQPPLRQRTPWLLLDRMLGRRDAWCGRGLPPAHLLRQVFETCESYGDALAVLRDAPVCAPVFYALSGLANGEGCIIERSQDEAAVRTAPASISNHWIGVKGNWPGRGRTAGTEERLRAMEALRGHAANDFSWLLPPILNPTTRIAAIANAMTSALMVQGWEREGPATHVFTLSEPYCGETRRTKPRLASVPPA